MSVIQAQKTALITGAASGVGFAIAQLCRQQGMHLALVDIDAANLSKARDALAAIDPSLQTAKYTFDVADRSKWTETATQIQSTFPTGLDLVVLNAGKGYRPQSTADGKLKPWMDVEYWHKVCYCHVQIYRDIWLTVRPSTPMSLASSTASMPSYH